MNMNTSELGERRVLVEPSPDPRFLWALVPLDCRRALAELQRTGRLQEARAEILREAAADLGRRRGPRVQMDVCWALEHAAERYLKRHPVAAAGLVNVRDQVAAISDCGSEVSKGGA